MKQPIAWSLRTPALLIALCLLTINLHAADPGTAVPASSAISDQKAGSVLFFNYVTSSECDPTIQNTDIAITNTNSSSYATISLFIVDASTGAVASHNFVCLTANQTISVLASDLAPGISGYALAVAVNSSGCPISFNYLVGGASVKLAQHRASLNAEAFAALFTGALACTNTATLAFDGVSYNQAPRALALSKVGSVLDGNQTLLVVNRFGGDLTSSVSPVGSFFGQLFDSTPTAFNFAFSGNSQFTRFLSDNFPLITPALTTAVPPGTSAWMQFWATNDVAILGAALNYNPHADVTPSSYSGGQNLHKLTLTTASFVIPISIPEC